MESDLKTVDEEIVNDECVAAADTAWQGNLAKRLMKSVRNGDVC
jgi:hypothetical protein